MLVRASLAVLEGRAGEARRYLRDALEVGDPMHGPELLGSVGDEETPLEVGW